MVPHEPQQHHYKIMLYVNKTSNSRNFVLFQVVDTGPLRSYKHKHKNNVVRFTRSKRKKFGAHWCRLRRYSLLQYFRSSCSRCWQANEFGVLFLEAQFYGDFRLTYHSEDPVLYPVGFNLWMHYLRHDPN